MKEVNIIKISGLKRKIDVKIKGEFLQKDREKLYRQIGKKLKVPGFRIGKAPLPLLEKHYGEFLKEEFVKRMLPVYFQEVIKEKKLQPAGLPRIYDVELKEEMFKFSVDVEIHPSFTIKEEVYKGIKITYRNREVEEKEIRKALDDLREIGSRVSGRRLEDDALAKWAGFPEFSYLYDAIEKEIFAKKLSQTKKEVTGQVVSYLLKEVKTEVPACIVEARYKELMKREKDLLKMEGVPQKDIDKYEKDISAKIRKTAEEQVRLFYILKAIAKQENLNIKEEKDNFVESVLGYILSYAQYVVK